MAAAVLSRPMGPVQLIVASYRRLLPGIAARQRQGHRASARAELKAAVSGLDLGKLESM
jgi:hypothetical protein